MKKHVLTSILLVILHNGVIAQDDIYSGFKLSTSYSFFSGSLQNTTSTKSVSSILGYGIGYYETVELSNRINLQVEFNFNSFGFSRRDTAEVTPTVKYRKEITRIQTFEVPLMIKYRVNNKLAIGAGYQIGFLSRGEEKSIDKDGNETIVKLENSNDNIPTTTGIIIDANYNTNKLMFGLRLLMTQSPLKTYEYLNNKTLTTNEINSNMNLSLYMGYKLFD